MIAKGTGGPPPQSPFGGPLTGPTDTMEPLAAGRNGEKDSRPPRTMQREWTRMVPRLYLDTCTLADAILEPAISTKPVDDRERERYLSQKIFIGWPDENLLISPFVLAEFIQLGSHSNYGRTLAQMRTIVETQLLPRTRFRFAECDLSLASTYDITGFEPKFLVRLRLDGGATMPSGEHFQGIHGTFDVTRAGQIVRSVSGGIPPDSQGLDPAAKWDDDARMTVEAPAFELAMFDTVGQIVYQTNAPWKDAFHFLYARWAHADMIVSTDRAFANRISRDVSLPGVVLPSFVESRVERLFPAFHREVFLSA